MNETDRKLLDAVVAQGYLTREQVDSLVTANRTTEKSYSDLLIENGVLSRDTVELMVKPTGATVLIPPAPAATPKPVEAMKGRIGKYVLLSELGRGGMGMVYKAWQEDLKRHVAIKVLTNEDPTAVERFQREAQMAGAIRHPGLVAVHEYGQHEGKPYIVMDFIAGDPLDRVMKRKRLSTRVAVEIVAAAADALAAAHKKQIIHRDIKPSNMIVDLSRPAEGPKVSLTDFGLAKPVNLREKLTQVGTILGTPHYMSPEQAKGHQRLDPRSDVYSLGAVLYELITARPVVDAPQVYEMLNRIITVEPVAPRVIDPRLPQDLETVVLKCLEKDASRRYKDAGEMAEDLKAFLEHRAVAAVPVGGVTRTVRWVKGKPWLMATFAAVLAAALGLTLFVALRSGRAENDALRGELADLQTRLASAKTVEERAAVQRAIDEKRAKLDHRASPPAEPKPVADTGVREAFEALKAQVLRAPRQYLTNVKACDAFLAAHGAAPEADGARRLRVELDAVRTAETVKVMIALDAGVAEQCRTLKFGTALRLLEVDPELDATAVNGRVTWLKAEIARLAAAAWEQLVERARGLPRDDARKVFEEALAFGLADYAAKVDEAIAALAAPPVEVKPPPDSPAALIASIASALLSDDVTKAKSLARSAAGLDDIARAIAGLDDLLARALAGFAQRTGEKTTLQLASGSTVKVEIIGVRGDGLVTKVIEYNAETTYRMKDLAMAEVLAAARKGGMEAGPLAIATVLQGGKPDRVEAIAPLLDALAVERRERAAIAAIEALRKSKDEKKTRDLLALIDGELGGTKAAEAAREEIEQVRLGLELKGIDVLSLVHATVERAAGAETHLEYGFATDAEMADWFVEQQMVNAGDIEGNEVRRLSDGLHIVNVRVSAGPAWRGGVEVELRLVADGPATGTLALWIDPFYVNWVPQTGAIGVGDRRAREPLFSGRGTPAALGQEVTIKLVLKGRSLRVVAGAVDETRAVEPFNEALQFRLQSTGNAKAWLKRLTLEGVMDAAWAKKAAVDKREPRVGPAVALFNGRTLAGWRPETADRWRAEGGALRGESVGNGDRETAQIITDKKFRNGRLSFDYKLERGRFTRVQFRSGVDAVIEWWLFSGEGGWRKFELVAVEERVSASIDGVPIKVEPRSGTVVPGYLWFDVRAGGVTLFRDIKIQPIDPPPAMSRWTDLFNGSLDGWKVLAGADKWSFDKGMLTADGPFAARSMLPFEVADITFRVKASEGSDAIFSFRFNGDRVGSDLAIPADGKWHEVTAALKPDQDVRVSLDGKAHPLRSRGQNGIAVDGNLYVDVKKGKLEINGLKAKQ